MTNNVKKTVALPHQVIVVDKLVRFLFSLALLSVLFMSWYPGMLASHPIEFPTPGWLLLLSSPFFLSVLFLGDFQLSLSLFILLVSYFLPWGSLILCLLQFLLSIRYRKVLMLINWVILGTSFCITIIVLVFFRAEHNNGLSAFLYGFWFYLGLLLLIILYEIMAQKTIQHRRV